MVVIDAARESNRSQPDSLRREYSFHALFMSEVLAFVLPLLMNLSVNHISYFSVLETLAIAPSRRIQS